MFDKPKYVRDYNKIWYRQHKDRLIEQRRARRQERKTKAVKLFGGKCQRCGYNKCITALEFHHPKGSGKEKDMGHLWHCTWQKILKELDGCEMVCSNCHRELHTLDIGLIV